ncbi:MAG: BatA and WFA domain-containing protein, partial [Clostridia bacterium]|nr:BatA and WFA domain-containing protein [Clostridia bacterium]
MRFLYPFGLLGLLGIPVLIVIYIIKNKYTEQVVSSTYLWTLSEKFLKRRNPINKLAGLVSLILQILAVLFLSVSIAHPVFTLPNLAREYCFILDGSGSMNMAHNGTTRLEKGKQEIASLINGSLSGSAYTLVYVGENTDVVFEGVEDKKRALTLLREVSPCYVTNGFNDAYVYAQEYFDRTPSVKTYLITDKEFERSSNVNIVNVSANEENYAVTGLNASVGADGTLAVSGKAISYASDAVVHVGLYLDGERRAVQTAELALNQLEPAEFSFECEDTEFRSVRVAITERDALALDNESVLFNEDYENSYRALIVSNTEAFFIRAALTSVGNIRMETVLAENYKGATGYDLYIYEGFTPDEIPQDGAIWFINPLSSVSGTGFSVQSEVTTG